MFHSMTVLLLSFQRTVAKTSLFMMMKIFETNEQKEAKRTK